MSGKSNLFSNYIRAKCIKVFTWIFDDWFVRCNVDRSKAQDDVGRQNSIPPLNWLLTFPVKSSNMMREANRMLLYQMLFLDIKSSATCRLLPTLSLILSVPTKFLLNFHKSFSRSSNFLNFAKMCYPKGLTDIRLVWWKSRVEIMFYRKRGILMTFFF